MSFKGKGRFWLVVGVGAALVLGTAWKLQEKAAPHRVILKTLPIEFYDARTVAGSSSTYREYREVDRSVNSDGVSFLGRGEKKILPGTPEYAEMLKGWELITGPDDVESVTLDPDKRASYPLVTFKSSAADKWEIWWMANNRRGEKVAMVVNGRVLTIIAAPDCAVYGAETVVPLPASALAAR